MNSFARGMGNFNLFPPQKTGQIGLEAAWQEVADAFAITGTNMRRAITDFNTQTQDAPPKKAHGKPRK
jgi:hypothetical protein